ncbi:MAG: hypothetical protein L3J95_05675 [Thermoplasmata archaeon]|nr:hypothetical protein [Thermoplasmata archaeon]MCI4359887.1 hypothetical protein [Thermoplasmata archaeon]
MSDPANPTLSCPFCGAALTDRIDVEGSRFLVFRCMFTPKVDPALSDAQLIEALPGAHPGTGPAYFRGVCDRLHVYVTQGEGARILTGPRSER